MDAEVVSVLRRGVLSGRLEEARARMVSAYEAFYVAAARARGLPLLTADGRLARASGLGIVVQSVRTG